MKQTKIFLSVMVALAITLLSGCPGLMAVVQRAVQGALLVGDALSIAEQVEKEWFTGHPDAEAQKKVDDALQKAHDAVAELQKVIDASKTSGKEEDVKASAGKVVAAYREVKTVVDGLPPVRVGEARASKLPIVSDVAKALGVSL